LPNLAATPKDLERKVHIADRDATVDGMYLRIIIHANQHMGQLIAYARTTGVVPPWAQASKCALCTPMVNTNPVLCPPTGLD
jgi:hypothetical protein